jgi:N-glycosylase/DNA lyase
MAVLRLTKNQPFSLDVTLSCGQVFRWEKEQNGWWGGIVGNRAIRIRQDGTTLTWEGAPRKFIEHYFSLDQDISAITASFDRDPFIHAAIDRCHGLRLVRQPPWECLISYICATNSNIPMIKRRTRKNGRSRSIHFRMSRHGDPSCSYRVSGQKPRTASCSFLSRNTRHSP